MEALCRLISTRAARNQVFNVGTDQEVSINQLAEKVRSAVGSSSEIVHLSYDEAYAEGFEDMPRRVPDISKLERVTGFRPVTPLDRIIADTVAFQRARLSVAV